MDARRTLHVARRWAGRATLLLIVGVATGALTAAVGARANTSAAPGHVVSVKDSPGYRPLVDPESMSIVIGRRLNAPRVSKPFRGGARSLDSLGRAICWALHHRDADSLLNLSITDDEFRDILWREFPQSRPVTGLIWEDAWKVLYARIHAGCMHAVRDHGGRFYEFVGFEDDTVTDYRNFKLHNRLTLVARDDEGQVQRWKWLRSAAERKGRFKIYSTED